LLVLTHTSKEGGASLLLQLEQALPRQLEAGG